ncbi:MAG: PRC protein [Candidatus Magasanikbacteria bacterium]|nr:PRC protein [Candidatus Magasanikbacteria bacterium]
MFYVIFNLAMYLTSETLIGLPVYTRSNQRLGRIVSFDVDADLQRISEYQVRRSLFSKRAIIVPASKVISISASRMIVEDAVAVTSSVRRAEVAPVAVSGAAMTAREE